MRNSTALAHVERTQIIAIIRGDLCGLGIQIGEVLHAAGITAMEVSLVSPDAVATIQLLAQQFGDRAAIGAGTVLRSDEVDQVYDAGASFIVSPNCNEAVISRTLQRGMASFPGAYTATEITHATELGADAVKLFPAVSLGPGYVSALRAPFPALRLVPTGGINLSNIRQYLEAGAVAVGVGSELVNPREFANLNERALYDRALALVAAKTGNHEG